MLNLPYQKEVSAGERRSRNEVELPKIARVQTAELGPIALRFHWLVQPREYFRDSLVEIQEEYNKLRKELIGLNEEAAKNVQRIAAKPSRKLQKSTDLSRVVQLSSKEGENNIAIITRLRVQLQRLEQRLISVSSTSKDQLDDNIAETKQQIIALRHRNKQLKQKSKEIGDNIETSDDIFGEIKRLEMELSVAERKKNKLSGKWKEVCSNLDKLKKGITDMKGEATSAENYIEEQLEQSQAQKEQKKQESAYHQRVLGIDIIKKNMQSFSTLKQLKYHQTLKQLEDITAKLATAENTINLSEEKQMRQKSELIQLQQELKIAVEKAKLRELEHVSHSLTQQEEEKQNQDDQGRNDKIVKIHRKKLSTKQQLRKSLNVRIESKEVKGKPTELRLNKSINTRQQKQLNTIDTSAFTDKTEQKKVVGKNSTSMKLNRMNRSYQQRQKQKQKNNISTDIGPQNIERKAFEKRGSQKNTLYEQKNEEGLQEIQQDICASYLKDQPLESKQQHIKEQNAVFISELPSTTPPKIIETQRETPTQDPQEKENEDESEEQSDEDIKEFKRSITQQMTNPTAGLGMRSVDIALGEIETTIKQHEQRSRINRYHEEKPIDEEQESFH